LTSAAAVLLDSLLLSWQLGGRLEGRASRDAAARAAISAALARPILNRAGHGMSERYSEDLSLCF
jgi:hypothetical protein